MKLFSCLHIFLAEKCLQYAPKRDRDEMIWKIINVTFDTNSPIDGKGYLTLFMNINYTLTTTIIFLQGIQP